ncbi:MAG: diacylglycerol/lipid kinase family protein [Kineosporiaceae bacterium]
MTTTRRPAAGSTGNGAIVLVANPVKVEDLGALLQRVAARSAELGLPVPRVVPTTEDDPGEGQARDAARAGAALVVVAGGDGTVRAAAHGLAHTGVPLGILPQGTGNLLARNLGIPGEEAEALDVALTGADRTIDLGRLDDDTAFAVMAGTGLDARMIHDAPEGLKGVLGWLAYIVGGARGLRHSRVRLRVRLDDGEARDVAVRTLLVGNVGRLQAGLQLLPDAIPDDGALDVALVAPRNAADWAVLIGRALTRRHRPDRRLQLLRGRRVEVVTRRAEPRQVDGELLPDAKGFTARVDPGALVVRVPRPVPDPGPRSSEQKGSTP